MNASQKAIYVGLLGEYAVALEISDRTGIRVHVDDRLYDGGDRGFDLQVYGLKIDVKNRGGRDFRSRVRVAVGRDKCALSFVENCDAYVFAEWLQSDRVVLLGWVWRKDVKHQPLVEGLGLWWNIVVEDGQLKPMGSLITEIKFRKEIKLGSTGKSWH